MTYLRNAWYAVAWKEDVGRDMQPFHFLDEEIVFYRTEAGAPVAVSNRCPHRFVELHTGKLLGDRVQCPYHGLEFDRTGACVRNPHGDGLIPERAKLRSYPVVERHGLVWMWAGEDDKADPDLIPGCFGILDRNNELAAVKGRLEIKANYQLVTDNLLDLTHAEYLHPQFRQSGQAERTVSKMRREGNDVVMNYFCPGEQAEGFAGILWEAGGGKIGDYTTVEREMRWTAPSSLCLDIWFTASGAPARSGVQFSSVHLLTPTNRGTTQYLWATLRNVRHDDPPFDAVVKQNISKAFMEQDAPPIESQQGYLGDHDLLDLHPAILGTDNAAVAARRTLRSLIQKEAAA